MYEYLLSPVWEKFSLPFFIESFPFFVLFFIICFTVLLFYFLDLILKYKFVFKRKVWLNLIKDLEKMQWDLELERSMFWWKYGKILRNFLFEFKDINAKTAILKDLKEILGNNIIGNIDDSYFLWYSNNLQDSFEIRDRTLKNTIKYIKSKIVIW